MGEDLRKWIAEGRLNAQSLAKSESDAEFHALSTFPEFADAFVLQAPRLPFSPATADADDGRDAALKLVKGPAIALIIVASLGVVYYGFSGLFTLFTGGMMFHQEMPSNIPPQMRAFIQGMQGPLAGLISLVIAVVNGFVLFGAIKLLRLQNFRLVMAAVIFAMLPCQCCCLLGLPFGIWALMVLNKPQVKSQFG
ncbi:MAG TPA: hypothetical protein VF480_11790 [Verrucomicrobiae bacterium]